MKTKFFKKLSFVLAFAMVLSVFAPAAGVFAAAKPKLNSTNKYLHLGVDKLDEYNFNISGKGNGWKYYWESANEDVAVVNEKNGVTTATGVGKTKVTVTITDKDKEVVAKLSATVTVRDNIKTVKISNPVEKLAVGEEHDYNRSYTTVSGSTKKTSAITRWTVNSDKATINDSGVFVATEAGEYEVTARSYQSKAKYEDWQKDAEKYADYVLATDTTKVTVAGSMVEAKQVDEDTVKVFFDSAMEGADKELKLYQRVGTTDVLQLVKEVKMADDKKSAEMTVYVPFTQEATYVIKHTGLEDVSFVAARRKAEDVAYIKVDTNRAEIGKSTEVVVKVFNANDVDITTPDLANRVSIEAEEVANTHFDGRFITIWEENKAVKVTATYHTYVWNETTGEEMGNLQAAGVIIGVNPDSTNITGLAAWTIVQEKADGTFAPNFDDVKQVIAAEDSGYALFVKLNTKTGSSTSSVNSFDNQDDFELESSNDEVMIVDPITGRLYPNKQGSVTVVVKYGKEDKTPVGAISITVGPKSKASNLVLGTTSITLSNVIGDSKDVSLKLTDQTGRDVPFTSADVDVRRASGAEVADFWTVAADGKKITFNGTVDAGRYSIKVTVKDVTRYVNVNVVTATAGAEVSRYALELGTNKVDLKAENKKVNKSISINLFGLAANGTKITNPAIDGDNFKIVVDAPYVSGANWDYDKDDHRRAGTSDNVSIAFDDLTVALFDGTNYTLAAAASGTSIRKAPVGNYKVTAYEYRDTNKDNVKDTWVAIGSQSFVVEDTQTIPVVSKIKTRVYDSVVAANKADVISVASDCFEIKLNGELMTDITDIDYSGTDTSIYVRSITVRKSFTINDNGDTAHIDFKVNVGVTIKQK